MARRKKPPKVVKMSLGREEIGLGFSSCPTYLFETALCICKRKIEEDTSGKSKTAIFHKWQPLSAYRLGRFLPWEASFRGIAVRESFQ